MASVEAEKDDTPALEVPDQSPPSGPSDEETDEDAVPIQIQPSADSLDIISSSQVRAAADFSVTVHDDTIAEGNDGENEDPARVSPSSNHHPSAANNSREKLQEVKTDSLSLDLPDVATPKAKGGRRRTNRRKRGRVVRPAEVDESASDKPKGLLLPCNQFETSFYRRAIRKQPDSSKGPPTTVTISATAPATSNKSGQEEKSQKESDAEVYGDISLGMKLSVAGGKVIVQHLNALADGRASPAQLTGLVQRGDVLVSINDLSLVNLPIDQLMAGLSPLSTPDATGAYQRTLNLRFAAGEGLELLTKSEAAQAKKADGSGLNADAQHRVDAVHDMMALFPMVDQLSGVPLFDDLQVAEPIADPKAIVSPNMDDQGLARPPGEAELGKKVAPIDDTISYRLAKERMNDRELFASEFYGWNEHYSGLLRQTIHTDEQSKKLHMSTQSLAELIEIGRRAILGAKALSKCLENVDRGLDVRSFRSWNSTISLYSRASTRRRYVLDNSSLPVNFGKVTEEEEEDESEEGSQASGESSDEEAVDGDELLLRLASHDEIWRKQVIEFLEEAIPEENDENEEQPQEAGAPETGGIDSALSKQLGSFLFGENMSKILTKNERPQALPSEEITAVLFDLATKVSTTVPDKITAAGSLVSYRSSLVPFTGIKRPASESDAMLATQFLLHEALPVWTKTFRPLPWEQRRVLWPVEKALSGEATAASTISDDNLTLDSWGTSQNSPGSVSHRKRKNLREIIEDQQLDVETRSETCFLVTYLFTQKMLPKLLYQKDDPEAFRKALDEISSFVKNFGSYLKMHTCLAYSALLQAEEVIDLLLEAAKYDPRHREMMKVTSKVNALVFYEPTMLSTVIQRLHLIRTEPSPERRLRTIDLCASAFPDVRPWQMKKECWPEGDTATESLTGAMKVELKELYYTYLSLLLHPSDGHEAARHDSSLVREWCELSTTAASKGSTEDKIKERRKHFLFVASRTSSDHLAYHRDLIMLLKLSMRIGEHGLALDLAGEIVDDALLSNDTDAVDLVLKSLREIGASALDADNKDQQKRSARMLKRIIRLYHKTSTKKNAAAGQMINVADELLQLLDHKRKRLFRSNPNDLIEFLADEANPSDMLKMLSIWTSLPDTTMEAIPVLHTLLGRGAHASMSSELSGSLLSLKRARLRLREENTMELRSNKDPDVDKVPDQSIWKKMSNGMVVVAK